MATPAASAEASTPRNFTFSCTAGVEPSQYPVFRSVIVCPDTDSAVQTIPAIAITKNIPAGAAQPEPQQHHDEMMIVSIVIPDTGLRAMVAMALAATEAKKNEKTNVSTRPTTMTDGEPEMLVKNTATASGAQHHAEQDGDERDVAVRALEGVGALGPQRKALNAIENEPATTRRDLMMPKMPGGGDGADADEPHVAAEDLRGASCRRSAPFPG